MLEHTTLPNPPATEVATDLEFIFLGGTKLTHTLREQDSFEDRGDHYYLTWKDTGEDALLFKLQLLQFGRRVRLIQKVEQTAVQQVVQAIKQKEAKDQGATVKAAPQSPATTPLPGVGASVPADLWDRSPLTR
jgi:hypothetical protein